MHLSIVTINYNNLSGLQKTIDSVLSQSFEDFEWIVIDGGSTDGSKELLEQYQEHFAYWCSVPDKGIYNAINKGIKLATGDIIGLLNSGDTALPDAYDEVLDYSKIESFEEYLTNVYFQSNDKDTKECIQHIISGGKWNIETVDRDRLLDLGIDKTSYDILLLGSTISSDNNVTESIVNIENNKTYRIKR